MDRPNIILILTDQQRHDTISVLGNPIIRTPALDRIAREGTVFDRCYTPSPVCVAARCSLMTGLPPHQTECCDNENMPSDLPSFIEKIAEVGYATHGVGKMHFTPDHTKMWGFQTRDMAEELKEKNDDYRDFVNWNGYGHVDEINGIRSEYYYVPQPSQFPTRLHTTNWTADRSIEFLENRDKDKPFFLMSSFLRPHPPFESPTPWNKLYRAAEMPPPHNPADESLVTFWNRLQNRFKYRGAWGNDEMLLRTLKAAYYSCISYVDYNIGRIVAALGDELDNTMILFTSDHGELLGDFGCVGKRTMHEASARIPLLVRYPKKFDQGKRSSTPVTLLDVHETILDVAQAKRDPHPERESLVELAKSSQPRTVFSQFSKRAFGQYLASNGKWKYSYSAPDRSETLIDLENDPLESVNLATHPDHSETLAELRGAAWKRFSQANYKDASTDAGWTLHALPSLPVDPDSTLIFQDHSKTDQRLKDLGPDYYRPVTVQGDAAFRPLLDIIEQA